MVKPKDIPSVLGIKMFCIISGSMEPEIYVNDLIIIKEVSKEEIFKGDIITFVNDGEVITHRVKKMEKNDIFVQENKGEFLEVKIVLPKKDRCFT